MDFIDIVVTGWDAGDLLPKLPCAGAAEALVAALGHPSPQRAKEVRASPEWGR